jgi:hypothetical protein
VESSARGARHASPSIASGAALGRLEGQVALAEGPPGARAAQTVRNS